MPPFALLSIAAMLLTSTPTQEPATPAPRPQPGGWTLESDEINCALTKWVGQNMLMLIGPSAESAGGIAISAPAIATVQPGDDPDLALAFDRDPPRILPATGVPAAGGTPGGYAVLLPLETLAQARPNGFTLNITRAGQPLYAFDASDAGPGMKALMDCSKAYLVAGSP